MVTTLIDGPTPKPARLRGVIATLRDRRLSLGLLVVLAGVGIGAAPDPWPSIGAGTLGLLGMLLGGIIADERVQLARLARPTQPMPPPPAR